MDFASGRSNALSPAQFKTILFVPFHFRPQLCAFPIQGFEQPVDALFRSTIDAQATDLFRDQNESKERAGGAIQNREVHERKIGPVRVITVNPFIVVQEVSAAVEDGPAAIDFDAFHMVRRVAIEHVYAGAVDQPMREVAFLGRDVKSPIAAPVDGSVSYTHLT